MKKIILQWKDAWRTSFYYLGFAIALNILQLPFKLVNLDVVSNNQVIFILFIVTIGLLYFPFTIQWASNISGLHPLNKDEAKAKLKRQQEQYKAIHRRNNPVKEKVDVETT